MKGEREELSSELQHRLKSLAKPWAGQKRSIASLSSVVFAAQEHGAFISEDWQKNPHEPLLFKMLII